MPTTPTVNNLPSTLTAGGALSSSSGSGANSAASAGDASLAGAASKTMGKEDFLKLLVTQLRFQDPMAPQDPKDFVAQLSQFSALEQQINTNANLKAMGILLQSVKNGNAMSQGLAMLGKTVTGVGNSITMSGGKSTPATYQLPQEAQEVTVTIYDGGGKAVRTLNLGRQAAGTRPITWDGKNNQGVPLPDGAYTYTVNAKTAKGQAVSVTSQFTGTVQEVYMDAKGVWVKVDGRPILIDNIVAINQG
ncbi:MAG: hypothetical protein FJ128_10060 [Deltaproteobacteria bacterium]|nr:hypothetical protein [Deltaproteobacteria bacterium]